MADEPQEPQQIKAMVLTPPEPDQVMVPMNPRSVQQSIKWWPGQTDEGDPVACVMLYSGRSSTYIELDEPFATAFIDGLKGIFGKPKLEIARALPPNGKSPFMPPS